MLRKNSSRKISSITLRILAINLTALLILSIGILYIVQYQDKLIQAELDAMKAEAQLFAGALAEGATESRVPLLIQPFQSTLNQTIIPGMAKRMVRRFSDVKAVEVTVFNAVGDIVAASEDSGYLKKEDIQQDSLAAPGASKTLFEICRNYLARLLNIIPARITLSPPPDLASRRITGYPIAIKAAEAKLSANAWKNPQSGEIFLSAAAPIIKVRQVAGVVYLKKSANAINKQIQDMQLEILRLFAIVFAFTIIMSFYLARNMAGPLKDLAHAARQIRNNKSRDIRIPDYSHRHDEIGQLSLALRDMTDTLWERMDAIEGFAADVSHELKNPLTSLRSAVETASKIKDEESLKTLMDIILHDVHRLDRLISDISKSSRLDAELSKEELEQLDLTAFFQEMKALHDTLSANDVEKEQSALIFHLPQNQPVWVLANKTRLTQVFDNLISNAMSFNPADKDIVVTLKTENGKAVMTVEDEGGGIPESKLGAIFDRFYTERPKGESYGNHSGLGLSIAKQIIDSLGGKIFATNIRNNRNEITGASFCVELNLLSSE